MDTPLRPIKVFRLFGSIPYNGNVRVAVVRFLLSTAAAEQGTGATHPDHETTKQLSDALPTTSTGKSPPTPPTCGKLDTNVQHQNALCQHTPCQNAPIRRYCTKIYCAGQPPIAPPTPGRQASDPARPAKQKTPNRPNLAAAFLHQHFTQHPAPRHRLSPQEPHSAKFAKRVYQTNPIPTTSDNAIAPASDNAVTPATGRPPPPVTQETQPSPNRRKSNYQTDPIPPLHEISRRTNQQHKPEPPSGDCHSYSPPHSINNGQPALAAKMS